MARVLIVEDDLMIADAMEELLIKNGYEICGIARTVTEAVALARRQRPDLAILDLRLAEGGRGTEVASQLAELGRIGILYATGSACEIDLMNDYGDACLSKPFRPNALLRSLEIVAEIVAEGTASPPFPYGLTILHPAALMEMH